MENDGAVNWWLMFRLNNLHKLLYLMKDAHSLHLCRVTAQLVQLVLSQQELLGNLIFF